MELSTLVFALSSIVIVCLIRKFTKKYGSLEAMGIPVIKPFLCFGSPPFGLHKIVWHKWYLEKHQQLGMTFGLYNGTSPIIVTIDPDIIRCVYVKNFEEFGDMVDNPHYDDSMKDIFLAQGGDWRNLRKIMSPTFTSGKLKLMVAPMADVTNKAMKYLDRLDKQEPIEMKKFFQGFAMDTICRCAFSIETNAHEDQNHSLVKAGRDAFQGFQVTSWIESMFFMLFYFFPRLDSTFPSVVYPEAFFKLQEITEQVVKDRITNSNHYGDFIDTIIEVCNDPKASVTMEMIKAQGKIFFAAGFETTSNCLTTVCFNLAQNPNIQEKLYNEIIESLAAQEKFDHNNIKELQYLEAVINENLRMYPPVASQERICKKDVEVKTGFKIKKGTYIRIPIYACHQNPEYFPDPDKFKPERFLKENSKALVPYTFLGFSGGPRICLGMRFAMIEMKICLANLLKKYKIKISPQTELQFNPGDLLLLNFKELFLTLEPRS